MYVHLTCCIMSESESEFEFCTFLDTLHFRKLRDALFEREQNYVQLKQTMNFA